MPFKPLITALMSTYNAASYVEKAIQSVLDQKMDDFEILIADDKSTDHTKSVVNSFADSRIRLLKMPTNVGVGAALNLCLSLVKGKYVAKVDADDINDPDRFSSQLSALETHPEWGMVKGVVDYFPDDDKVAKTWRYKWMKNVKEPEINAVDTPQAIANTLPDWCCITHNTIMVRTEIIRHYGYPPWRMGEDYALFYRMNQDRMPMGMVNQAVVYTRVRSNSTTGAGQHQLQWVVNLYGLKRRRILDFIGAAERICVIGGGQLARGLGLCLAADGVEVQVGLEWKSGIGFLPLPGSFQFECDAISSPQSEWKIIVACQPVRQEVCSALIRKGLRQNEDYFIIA